MKINEYKRMKSVDYSQKISKYSKLKMYIFPYIFVLVSSHHSLYTIKPCTLVGNLLCVGVKGSGIAARRGGPSRIDTLYLTASRRE